MATGKKILKRSASNTPVPIDPIINNALQAAVEWSNDHEFISPDEIYAKAVGLLFCLTTRRLINISFTNLYRQSLKITWTNLLHRERRNLKLNIKSVAKCFMLNRLLTECQKDPYKFARETGELYEEIKMGMSSAVTTTWTMEDFYGQVLSRQNLQCQRRLFHISYDEANRPSSLLTLQCIATALCSQLLISYQTNPTMENYNNLKQFLHHSFIIAAQPSIPECVAATKYEKSGNTYLAKLYARIVCLIDPDAVGKYFTLSNVVVTLRPFDRYLDLSGEDQAELIWHSRPIRDADEVLKSFLYVELESIELTKTDIRNSRPLYSAKLCQLQFHLKIGIKEMNTEESVTLSSQLFGLCSHAQYYPEYVAKVLLYEVTQMPQSSGSIVQPNILTNYIHRYHTRISGVEAKIHTSQYITDILQAAYEKRKELPNATTFEVYEEIVAKLISQMEMYFDHPFLSMMYQDGLFLGICNSSLDQQLHGTREQPQILLRFNTLFTHQPTEHASVRFIVHNGQLIKATFHAKAFVDEMCRMIGEANSHRAKDLQFLLQIPYRSFHEFSLYFDNDLYRLNKAASPIEGTYQPLIPVLWNTMRINTDEQELNSPTFNLELLPVDLSQSNLTATNETQSDLSNVFVPLDRVTTCNEIVQMTVIARHVVEKLSNLLTESSTLLPTLLSGDIHQQKELLSRLLLDSFPTKIHVDVATQTSSSVSSKSPDNDSEHTELRD